MPKHVQTAIIIGAGYSGLTAAVMLARLGLDITVLERGPVPAKASYNPKEPSRLLALAHGSVAAYKRAGISQIERLGQAINHIRLWDRGSGAILDFAPEEVGEHCFGYMLEERILMEMLQREVSELSNIQIHYGMPPKKVQQRPASVIVECASQQFTAELLVIADGRSSKLAKRLGIESQTCDYQQYGIVCDIEHEHDHCGVAVEICLPGGPFAILPKPGGYKSSLVWVEPKAQAEAIVGMAAADVETLLAARFDGYLGQIQLASKLRLFPLHSVVCTQYYSERTALIGDAAHAIHPLAGQGFNLAVRDIICLTEQVSEQLQAGLDIGSLSMLQQYNNLRQFDSNLMIEATDTLNRLFSNNTGTIRAFRGLGIRAVNELGPLKRRIIRYAMGYHS